MGKLPVSILLMLCLSLNSALPQGLFYLFDRTAMTAAAETNSTIINFCSMSAVPIAIITNLFLAGRTGAETAPSRSPDKKQKKEESSPAAVTFENSEFKKRMEKSSPFEMNIPVMTALCVVSNRILQCRGPGQDGMLIYLFLLLLLLMARIHPRAPGIESMLCCFNHKILQPCRCNSQQGFLLYSFILRGD